MFRRRFLCFLLFALLAGILGTNAPATAPARQKHVFIVSFDGGKPAVMRESRMPVTLQMARDGAVTWNAQTIFPSVTLVSHTTMLTGVGPAKNQVTWNDWQPQRGVVGVPTIFALARKAGYKTALFAGKEKFAHLYQPGSLNAFAIPGYDARIVAQAAADYIRREQPDLCFVHFADSDGAGHAHGWGSEEQKKAFADEDDALSVLRQAVKDAGIESSSVFILTADHGGHDKTHGTQSPEDMTIPWIAWGVGVAKNHVITQPVTTYDTAATALYLLGVPLPDDFDGKPVTEAFSLPGTVTARP